MKIYIDNEEVLCDKEITIKEELLNTSSTILKNCYPKSWETTKDYTGWYFPKDYSVCKIYSKSSLLPPEYTQVEYIESSGTQYIDSGVKLGVDYGFDVKFYTTNSVTGGTFGAIFGGRDGSGNKDYQLTTFKTNSLGDGGTLRWSGSSGTTAVNAKLNSNIIQECSLRNKIYTAPDNTQSQIISTSADSSYNAYIFGLNNAGSFVQSGNGCRIYYLRFYNGDTLIRNFIPCYRNSDNKIGLYDLVNNVFYVNKGTGEFSYGDVVNELIFCGVAKNTGNVSLNPREPHYVDIQILDFKTFLSEGETLDYVITNQTVTQAITTVINTISDYGFVVGNIQIVDDTTIGAYSTLDKTPYDVFQYFANITGTRWFTRMIDDQTVAIDFYDPTMLNRGQNIEYTKEYFETNDIIDMKFNYSTKDYRNKQVVKSSRVFGGTNYTETFIADGASDTYILSANVGKIVSIKLGSQNLTFTTKENRELGYTADVYYSFNQNSLVTENVFLQNAVMQVTYTPLVEGRQVIYNSDEVNRIETSTGRKGVVARYENRNDTVDSNELYLIGKSYIRYKGTSEITLTIKSRQNLWNIGEVVYFDAPINELDKNYMVKSKTIQRLPLNNVIFYTYEMTSSFNDERAINYFDNQRAKNYGNIGEGQFIKRNIDIPNQVVIVFDNLQVEEVV